MWEDEPDNAVGGGWQSGVRYLSGKKKPAFAVFPNPFWAERAKRGVARLWGQHRPRRRRPTVTIERKSGSSWKTVATVKTDGRGAFRRDVRDQHEDDVPLPLGRRDQRAALRLARSARR